MYKKTKIVGILYSISNAFGLLAGIVSIIGGLIFITTGDAIVNGETGSALGDLFYSLSLGIFGGTIAVLGWILVVVGIFIIIFSIIFFMWSIRISKKGNLGPVEFKAKRGGTIFFIVLNLGAALIMLISLIATAGSASSEEAGAAIDSITPIISSIIIPVVFNVMLILDLIKNNKDLKKA